MKATTKYRCIEHLLRKEREDIEYDEWYLDKSESQPDFCEALSLLIREKKNDYKKQLVKYNLLEDFELMAIVLGSINDIEKE